MTVEPVPVRMLNEVAYCERLFALEWLGDEWADNADTVKGRSAHRRVDAPGRTGLVEPEDPDAPKVARSVKLSDDALGLLAVIDLVEVAENGEVMPIDYKKSQAPDVPEGAWEPERVQVAAQAMLLRAHGYRVSAGVLYFVGSKRRVAVPLTPELESRVLALRDRARAIAAHPGVLPPPLIDSPKCPRCSLVAICLPDETNTALGRDDRVRPLVPLRDDGAPLVLTGRVSAGKDGGEIAVKEDGKVVAKVRIADTNQVVVWGHGTVTTPLLHALAERDVPVSFHSYGGWYIGGFVAASGIGALLRVAQHGAAADPDRSLAIARRFVEAKIRNTRVLLRRNGSVSEDVLQRLAGYADDALKAPSAESLLGVEGNAARVYFEHFDTMLKEDHGFKLDGRNRRPPMDPVNALLSFAYANLVREVQHALQRVGFDPFAGFLHRPRYGRPALALDLMEEFRPVIADSVVLTALNHAEVRADDFIVRPTGVALGDSGRRRFFSVFERRMDEEATHPVVGTRASMRRMLELQARLLARHLTGEIPEYIPMTTR